MDIVITIKTDETVSKLKNIRGIETSKVEDIVSPKVIEMMDLLKKRLDRQSEPTGG